LEFLIEGYEIKRGRLVYLKEAFVFVAKDLERFIPVLDLFIVHSIKIFRDGTPRVRG